MQHKIAILTPVFNDWNAASQLIHNIIDAYKDTFELHFIVVDDSSTEKSDFNHYKNEIDISVIEMTRNMGHQKAIATGLSYINDHIEADFVIVMDSDGEDQPDTIKDLLSIASKNNQIVFAKRTKRSEGLLFRIFYNLYKLIFLLLTGQKISFGNFCAIPFTYVHKIVQVSDIWNHFSGSIIRSGIPYTSEPAERGKRYHGNSKMNFPRLILHGLSAVSVYADIMAVRLILVSFFLIACAVVGIFAVASVRLFTDLAIPGWATFTVLALVILLFLSLLLGLLLLFNVLIMKTQKQIIPAKDYKDFILKVTKI
jgi:glycosyltransferase involved in cell wall biosynthesis